MLKKRVVTGVLLAAFFLGAILFAPAWALVVLMCAVYSLAQLEYCEMCEAGGYKLERVGIFTCGLLFLLATVLETGAFEGAAAWLDMLPCPPTAALFCLMPAFLMIQSVLRRKTERAAECLGLSMLGVWYVAVLMSFMVRLTLCGAWGGLGQIWLIICIVIVKMSDIGAYTFGMLWGQKIKRRLIPEISPAKSIPGLAGAYVGSLLPVGPIVMVYSWLGGPDSGRGTLCLALLVLAPVLATMGVLGDLAESLLKRSFGVKDSSHRFPGLGGFLDVLDSLLFAVPFGYLLIAWLMR